LWLVGVYPEELRDGGLFAFTQTRSKVHWTFAAFFLRQKKKERKK
jgi:hypothetical protein